MLHEGNVGTGDDAEHRQVVVPRGRAAAETEHPRPFAGAQVPHAHDVLRQLRKAFTAPEETAHPRDRLGLLGKLVLAVRASIHAAHRAEGAPVMAQGVLRRELEAAEGAGHILVSHSPIRLSTLPTRKANGKMKAAIRQATRIPCSFPIIRKFAKQGMNRVMVTIATSTW